jgi:hypothetical protein
MRFRAKKILCIALLAIIIIIFLLSSNDNSVKFDFNLLYKDINESLLYEYHVELVNYTQSNITVLSIFYNLTQSKHSYIEYTKWVTNFATSISTPLVLICDYKSFPVLKNLRAGRPTLYHVTKSIWYFMRLLESSRNKSYIEDYITYQYEIDPLKSYHNPNLYAIWNLKPYLMNYYSKKNPFKSKYFIYTDAGAWREKKFNNWPNTTFILNELLPFQRDRILLSQVFANVTKLDVNDIIEGGFFAGTRNAIRQFTHHFYFIHDYRLDLKLFAGVDQQILNLLAFQQAPQSVLRFKAWEIQCNGSTDFWFVYQFYLASSSEFTCPLNKLSFIV